MTNLAFWRNWRDDLLRPSFRLTRGVFLRGMGIVYVSAFTSLAVQLDGLIGSRGILPAAEYLTRAKQVLGSGPAIYWRLPTLLWLNTSDAALYALCWSGIALGVALCAGLLPGVTTALLWLFYLSLVVVGQQFLSFQWDTLLLEAGLLAMLAAPWSLWLGRANDRPWWVTTGLLRWLVFRLMFLSGVVKLTSHDPTWRDWSALDYHYQTQPLPTWTSWYVHQLPPSFHRLSVLFMFYAELVAPFFVFGPRPVRLVGFASLVLLQLLIAATGNYGFFNLLALVLCLCILDDYDWHRLRGFLRRGEARDGSGNNEAGKPWWWPRRLVVGAAAVLIVATTASETIESAWPEAIVPSELVTLTEWLAPLRSTNRYGLFAMMTTTRPEIMVEGSDDGVSWLPYLFRWKPCELDRAPRFTTPHLPRLDWQMWFAALSGDCRSAPWFLRFQARLLEGEPAVLGLLRDCPFVDHPPRYVRARLFLYTFTESNSPDWWAREYQGLYCPALTRDQFEAQRPSLKLEGLRHQRQRSEAKAGGVEDGVADRRRDGDDRCFAGPCGRQVLTVKQYDIDLRRVAEPGNAIPRESRIGDPAAVVVDGLEQGTAQPHHKRAFDLVFEMVWVDDGAAFKGACGAHDRNATARAVDLD